MHRDLFFGGATLVVAALYYAAASAIPDSLLADAVGPRGLPETYAVLLAALSLVLIVRSVGARQVPSRGEHPEPGPRRRAFARMLGVLAIGALYVVAVPWIGYAPAIAGLIAATVYYQGGTMTRHVGLVALSGAAVFWLLFVRLLRIPQPPGLWPSLF